MALSIESLVVSYPRPGGARTTILDIPSFVIEDGARLCLVGGSGSGKTTLLNVLAGIVMPTGGRVRYGDQDITALPEAQRDAFRARNLGYVFQTFNLLQGLSALENVALAATIAGTGRKLAHDQARDLLVRVGLEHRLTARPSQMSVGEQQRTAIARAVVNKPGTVLADEPTANLDPENGMQVIDLLQKVTGEAGARLVLVTHEPEVQARFDRVVQLKELAA